MFERFQEFYIYSPDWLLHNLAAIGCIVVLAVSIVWPISSFRRKRKERIISEMKEELTALMNDTNARLLDGDALVEPKEVERILDNVSELFVAAQDKASNLGYKDFALDIAVKFNNYSTDLDMALTMRVFSMVL